jgi:hypothetical protein
VDQSGGLEGLSWSFTGEFRTGQASEFGIDERDKFLRCSRIAGVSTFQNKREFAHSDRIVGGIA